MARSLFNTIDNLSLKDIESDADLIPLMTTEDEEALENEALPNAVPILPLRNTVPARCLLAIIPFRLAEWGISRRSNWPSVWTISAYRWDD